MRIRGFAAVVFLLVTASTALAQDIEWRHYASDQFSTRYSPAALIDRENVDRLEVAWRWRSPRRMGMQKDRMVQDNGPGPSLRRL